MTKPPKVAAEEACYLCGDWMTSPANAIKTRRPVFLEGVSLTKFEWLSTLVVEANKIMDEACRWKLPSYTRDEFLAKTFVRPKNHTCRAASGEWSLRAVLGLKPTDRLPDTYARHLNPDRVREFLRSPRPAHARCQQGLRQCVAAMWSRRDDVIKYVRAHGGRVEDPPSRVCQPRPQKKRHTSPPPADSVEPDATNPGPAKRLRSSAP